MNKTVLIISSVIICFTIFIITACNGDKLKEAKAEVARQEASQEEVIEEIAEPVIPETNEPIDEHKAWTTYWYVSYDVHISSGDTRYTGYTIVVLETTYFDVERSIKQIVPTYVKEDFVNIQFFQQVPVETYKSFQKSDI